MTDAPAILCVDDDEDIREWLSLVLGARGYRVTQAAGGQEALQAAAEAPDVILLDVTMPDMSGYDVCARLQERKETACIPVIFVTALGGEKDKARALSAGAADHVSKPIDETVLVGKIQAHLATKKRWQALSRRAPTAAPPDRPEGGDRWDGRMSPSGFARFRNFMVERLKPSPERKAALGRLNAGQLYAQASDLQIPPPRTAELVAEFLSLPCVSRINPEDVRLGVLPTPFCRANGIVAVGDPSGAPAFVLSNPFLWDVLEAIRGVVERGKAPRLSIAPPDSLEALLSAPQEGAAPRPTLSDIQARLKETLQPEAAVPEGISEEANEQSAPVIQLVNHLIESAYEAGASDIHIEPAEDEVVVRSRIDGDLHVTNRFRPASLVRPIVARIKIMSQLDITEHRLPQDGRIAFKAISSRGADFDLRVAVAPCQHGEKAVLRILDKQKAVLPLEKLGFSARNLAAYRKVISAPYGMVLHAGPTGSGKSMSLYAALNEIKSPSINVQTAEDPVEYTLPGINQLQVNPEIGLTFARALRSFLRLDPDVILVGEIRDPETARTAADASLTRHPLLSTTHTNDAASAVARFTEMKIEPYLISNSLLMVCAQRLLRRLCPFCKQSCEPGPEERRLLGAGPGEEIVLFRPRGCDACHKIGYKGRIGAYEVLVINDALRAAINEPGVTAERLKRLAVERDGMTTLWWDAIEKARAGITSIEEILANVRPDEFDARQK